ncbi:HIRAN domain-containing protein [Leifsonia sp. NPDC014704]|uniref:HIRAN domain-containing protein n=1 Tax=Leifsonia sp. NPDC014704 TaxID=3364123 RepID=UPI0036F49371
MRDLTGLESVRLHIRGTYAYVPDSRWADFGGTEYLLVREPTNTNDASAVAVYGRERKVGYVSSSKAASLAPLLDQLDDCDGFVVSGASTSDTSIRLWVDLPTFPALRAYVKRNAAPSS